MNYRSFAIATILLSLLCLGAALISCNDGGEDEGAEPQIASAPPTDSVPARPSDAVEDTGPADGTGEPAMAENAGEDVPEVAPSAFVTGEGVYKAANCEMCHGKELQGSNLAPALDDLARDWEAAALAEYLADPEGYSENDVRLKANMVQYKLPMPAWKQTGLGESDMLLLIDWLLERE